MTVDPRQKYRYQPAYAPDPSTDVNPRPGEGGPGPDGGPQGPPPAGGGSDFWSRFLAAIKPYLGATYYDQIAGSQSQLSGLMGAAEGAFGGADSIMKYLGHNPLKGAYTALSYLNNTPYYDKGNAEDGSETWKAFYVPGYDYDPNTAGVQGPSWINKPYDPNAHVYKT